MRGLALAAAICLLVLTAGCGDDDDGAGSREPEVKLRLVYERIDSTLADTAQEVPDASRPTGQPAIEGPPTPAAMEPFLDSVLADLERYWTRTLAEDGSDPALTVKHEWLAPGERLETACRAGPGQNYVADDDAAAYCSGDDTIYFSSRFAAEIWQGIRERGLPGREAGHGRALGDFGVAYVVAHEYGHNLQWELAVGGEAQERFIASRELELNADCLAGLWANSVYLEGRIDPGDVQEAIGTVLAVGDFDVEAPDHHGTPAERREAWQTGYSNGDPEDCRAYVEEAG